MSSAKHGRSSSGKDANQETIRVTLPEDVVEETAEQPKKKEMKRHRYSKSVRITAMIMSGFLSLVGCGLVTVGGLICYAIEQAKFDDGEQMPAGKLEIEIDKADIEKPEDALEFDPGAYENSSLGEIPVMGNTEHITNILLMGVDGHSYDGQRADTNIILSINTATKTVKLISLMRDTWVTIPGYDSDGDGWDDYRKFNAAYASGGFALHSKMIEQNLRLKIDKYVAVNFDAFPQVIDAMGGVDFTLTGGEAERVPAKGSKITYGGAGYVPMGTTDGTYHMDGFQALQFARLRYYYADSDFTRTSNQRKLISALMAKAKDLSIGDLLGVLTEALGTVKTNMSRDEFVGFIMSATSYRNYDIDTSYRVPQDNASINSWIGQGVGLELIDPPQSVAELHEFIYAK